MNTTSSTQSNAPFNQPAVPAVPTELVDEEEVVTSRRVKEVTDGTWLKYDPIAVAEYYSSQPLKVFARFIGIFFPMISFAFGLWIDKITNSSKKNLGKRATQIRKLLTKLGPAYIKIGPMRAVRGV